MPSSVTSLSVTKFRPGQHTITLASTIFMDGLSPVGQKTAPPPARQDLVASADADRRVRRTTAPRRSPGHAHPAPAGSQALHEVRKGGLRPGPGLPSLRPAPAS